MISISSPGVDANIIIFIVMVLGVNEALQLCLEYCLYERAMGVKPMLLVRNMAIWRQ